MAEVFDSVLSNIEREAERLERPRAFQDPKVATAFRADLFQLEGWARLHLDWPVPKEREIFERIHDRTKDLEDVLGRYDFERSLLAEFELRGVTTLVDHAEDEVKRVRKDLKEVLREEKWFPRKGSSRAFKMRRLLDEVRWPPNYEAWLLRRMKDLVVDVRKKYDRKLRKEMMRSTYDGDIVENGVHEWRRALRWIPICFQTARGLVALGPLSARNPAPARTLIKAYVDSPFTQLPVRKNTILKIDPLAFFEITRQIDELGRLKSSGETYFLAKERLVKAGEADAEKSAEIVESWYGNVPRELPPQIHELLKTFDLADPLSALERALTKSRT